MAHPELALAYVGKGGCDKAIVQLQRGLERLPQHPNLLGMLAYAYALAGKHDESQKVLADLKALASRRYGYAFPMAQVYAARGENDQAFDRLQKACDERVAGVIWLQVEPTMDKLRSAPRFDRLLQRMDLADKPAARKTIGKDRQRK